MGKTEIIAEPGSQTIDIARTFDAPRELVFRAFSDPALVGRWMGGRKHAIEIETWEPQDGGRWRYLHRTEDGQEFAFHGVFHGDHAVDTGITQTFEYEGWPGQVSLEKITFEGQGDRSLVRIHSVYPSVAARDAMIESGMEEGMNDGLDLLDEVLAALLVER